jgi:hypothetical protein
MPFVAITRLRVRSWRYLPLFAVQALRSARQAASADGSLAVRLLKYERNTFWTATAWTHEQAMRKFMLAAPHGPVMLKLLDWCDEASVAHWNQESPELPAWPVLSARMQTDGRRSKVNHPSADHTAYRIPQLPNNPRGALRFK